jgi:alanyl aminopeptidase
MQPDCLGEFRMRFTLAALGMVFIAGVAVAADGDYPKGQLPDTVIPTHYNVDLMVLPEDERFAGAVAIDVDVKAATKVIWLHGQDLSVETSTVIPAKGKPIPVKMEEIPNSGGVMKLWSEETIPAGKARIQVKYTAPFNRQLEGLYRSDEGGDSYAFSQMEPIFARRAIPSFDEPRFKTPFDTSLTVRTKHVAISNTREIKVEKVNAELKRVTFATTLPLPTYLLAFAVGPLDVVEWKPIRKTEIRNVTIPLRGITARGKGPQIKYALENTEALLLTLERYFGIPYPYDKLDLVAATDFSAGAMENAGAIFYREVLMLFADDAPLSQKRRYALTHAHEMAHQWFGNLVTPAWWNDIWLNEAFATWMEYKTAKEWNPNGEYGRLSLSESLAAMTVDSWKNARQIAQPILSNDDISNAFDSITYDKGGGVLDMFERYYGEEGFRKGVKLHMERYRFGVATAKDFLQSIADANNDTEGVEAFQTFLNQPGVPFVEAELKCSSSGAKLNVEQRRYFVAGAEPDAQQKAQTWNIPMCVAFGTGDDRQQLCKVVKGKEDTINLKTKACPAWVMPNADGAGYFRYGMKEKQWDKLIVNASVLTEKEVLSILDSLDAAFTGGDADVDLYLERVRSLLKRGGKLAPWDVASAPMGRLAWIKENLVKEDTKAKVRAYLDELYSPFYDKLGLDPNTELDKSNPIQATLMRTPLVSLMALQAERRDVRQELAKRGAAYLGIGSGGKLNPSAIDPSLADVALIVAMQEMGQPVADAIIAHLKTERAALVRTRMLTALARSKDPAIAEKARALALSPDLRTNEVPILVYGAVREPANAEAGWEWFKQNIDAIIERTPPNDRGDLSNVGAAFCSKDKQEDYKKFFEPRINSLTGGPRQMAQTLERMEACRALIDKQRGKAERYFRNQTGSGS